MLDRTLARVQLVVPRHRILIVVSEDHRSEVRQQLAHWPAENIIFQPANRDTTAGLLLPLAHVTHRDPFATVAIFPPTILCSTNDNSWIVSDVRCGKPSGTPGR
jgi:mannose-1-phosphate guanylyltransferase